MGTVTRNIGVSTRITLLGNGLLSTAGSTKHSVGMFGNMHAYVIVALVTGEYLATARKPEPSVRLFVVATGALVRKRLANLNPQILLGTLANMHLLQTVGRDCIIVNHLKCALGDSNRHANMAHPTVDSGRKAALETLERLRERLRTVHASRNK